MRYLFLAVAAWMLSGPAPTAPIDEPAAKDAPKISAEEVDRLIIQLGDDDAAKRQQARKQLEAGGETVIAGLKKAVESADDPEVRKAAKAMIDSLGARASGVLHVFGGHNNRVNGVAITADGKRAMSASWDGVLRYWDLEDHSLIRQLGGGPGVSWSYTAQGNVTFNAATSTYGLNLLPPSGVSPPTAWKAVPAPRAEKVTKATGDVWPAGSWNSGGLG